MIFENLGIQKQWDDKEYNLENFNTVEEIL